MMGLYEGNIPDSNELTDWHIVETTLDWDMMFDCTPTKQLAWLNERGVSFRYGVFSRGSRQKQAFNRFYVPPEKARDAMLFKLTWGG